MHRRLHRATNRLNEVRRALKTRGPQVITARGAKEAAIISIAEDRNLESREGSPFDFLRGSPRRGVDLAADRSREIEEQNEAVAAASGHAMRHVQKLGRPARLIVGFTAATALQQELSLVTRNTRDFTDFGVELLNPWR